MSSSGKSQFYAETAHRFADCCLHTLAQWSSLRTSKASRACINSACLSVKSQHTTALGLPSPAGTVRNMWDSHGLKSAGTNSGLESSVHRYKNLILDQTNWFFVCCSTWCGAIMSHRLTILSSSIQLSVKLWLWNLCINISSRHLVWTLCHR